MILFVGNVSVAEAAERLGVGVPRIHQRIADGSLSAERIGSQWVVDERSLLRVAERTVGRPLSERSAWALIALAAVDTEALAGLVPVERARAQERLDRLLAKADGPLSDEDQLREFAQLLRGWLRNRAERRSYRAAPADLPALRTDDRVALSGLSAAAGIASGDIVEGYIAADRLEQLVTAYLLVPEQDEANVLLHVVAAEHLHHVRSPLVIAADLADRRGPREELRAAEIVADIAHEGAG